MKQIWKFELLSGAIDVPKDAKFLSCKATIQFQGVKLCVWMLVDPDADPETRRYRIIGTGRAFDPEGYEYFATVQDGEGFVWHLFWEVQS